MKVFEWLVVSNGKGTKALRLADVGFGAHHNYPVRDGIVFYESTENLIGAAQVYTAAVIQ